MMDVNKILENLINNMSLISPDDIPNISLYMDQVTTFMDNHLYSVKRFEDDKALTKTMINNYAKNNLLPSPEKKKYTKEHILVLLFIYYFKGVLSIGDIQVLLNPITEQFFKKEDGFKLEDIYEEVFSLEELEIANLKADVEKKFKDSQKLFDDAPKESQEFLKQFAFICMLSYDVYVKKLLIEKMIDEMCKGTEGKNASKKESKKEAKKETK